MITPPRLARVQSNRVAMYVYLPREAVRKLSLKKGDLMQIEVQPDGSLLLRPLEIRVKEAIPVERKEETGPPAPATGDPEPRAGGLARDGGCERGI